jgi:Ca2+-binding RTX toxin-like protein
MPAITFDENTVNAHPQLLVPSIALNTSGIFSPVTATLSVSGLLAEDRISIRNQGTGAGQIGFSGGSVTYGGVIIGTASGGAGSDFVITFNASATLAAIEALIENITYANVSDTPTASHPLILDVTDAAGVSALMPSFIQMAGAANPLNGINVGIYSTPVFGDLDGDGDLDMIAGEEDGTLNYFQNTGTATAPVFAAPVAIGSDVGLFSAPALGDLDGDGDLDMIVGEEDGVLNYFQNTGTATAPVFTAPVSIGSNVGLASTPALGDLDGDGDLDMVVGERDGVLNYFENTGTATSPNFTTPPNTIGSDVGDFSTPALGDLDGDGDLDMVAGEEDGVLNYFENTGTTAVPVFAAPVTIGNDAGIASAPALADMNGDGYLDIVVGRFDGDFVTFFNNVTPRITVNVTAQNDAPHIAQIATSLTFAEGAVNAQQQLLDADVTLTDPEGNFANGSVTVSGLLAEDRISIRNQGTGAGQIGFSGGNVTYGGVIIGAASGGAGGNFNVTFNARATTAAVEALVENLTYANASNTPTASRTLVLDVRDGAGASAIAPTLSFTEVGGAANPLNGIDIGNFSTPVFGDLDGDGDLDMVVGEDFGVLNYFENTGTATAPVFAAPVTISSPVGFLSTPALADMDGDGYLDIVVGRNIGDFVTFINSVAPRITVNVTANPDPTLGDDTLAGTAFNDTIDMLAGNDSYTGGDGDDSVLGNSGNDTLIGGQGNDTLIGGQGNDSLDGGANEDVLQGDGGDNSLSGGSGNDTLIGGAGNDVFDGGGNNDVVDYSAAGTGVRVDLSNAAAQNTNFGTDTLIGIESIIGSGFNDTLTGSTGANTLLGGAGNDSLVGGGGSDSLDGGSGNDRMLGGALNDFYFVDSIGDIVTELANEGTADTVRTTLNTYTLPSQVERVIFVGTGNFVGLGNSGSNQFNGNIGDDRFVDVAGGNDTISAGSGSDSMDFRSSTTGVVINLATGVHGGAAAGDLYSSIEKFFGSNTQADTMTAGAGRANFSGFGGNDTLTGGSNIDGLQGNAGNDSLNGAGGIDNLDGGAGNDTLRGGSGKDLFVYSAAGFGQDIIVDFEDASDKLKVHSSIANNIAAFNITGNGSTSVLLTQMSSPTNTITLQSTSAINITAADFLFY